MPLKVPHLKPPGLVQQPQAEVVAADACMADHNHRLTRLEVGLQRCEPFIGLAQGSMQHRPGEGCDCEFSRLTHIYQLG